MDFVKLCDSFTLIAKIILLSFSNVLPIYNILFWREKFDYIFKTYINDKIYPCRISLDLS